MPVKPDMLSDSKKRAWDYFQLHASQRLTTFNFYIVISSLVITGILGTYQKDYRAPILGVGLSLLLTLWSVLFWKLDQRNRFLIKNAEAALKHFEELEASGTGTEPDVNQIFLREELDTAKLKGAAKWGSARPLSYSNCFNTVFFVLGASGAALAGYSAADGSRRKSPSPVVDSLKPTTSPVHPPMNLNAGCPQTTSTPVPALIPSRPPTTNAEPR
jgi:hypothetical protein